MTNPSDPRALLERSFDVAAGVLEGVADDQWGLPTPCTELDVLQLSAHIAGAAGRPAAIVSGAGIEAGLELPADVDARTLAASLKAAAAESNAAFSADGTLDRDFTLPWGTYSGRSIAEMYAIEMATHAWDLAVATGQSDRLDDGLAESLLPAAEQMIPAGLRGGEMPFEAAVEADPGAGAADRLAAFLGRQRI